MTEDELIARHIEPNPNKRGADEAWLGDHAISVWAIVGKSQAYNGDLLEVAASYEIPLEAVEVAMAYYRRHQCAIDNRLAANVL